MVTLNQESTLTSYRYKPHVTARFLAEELGFESKEEALDFLIKYGAQEFLEEKDDDVYLKTDKAFAIIEGRKKASFSTVDIKGQM